MQIRNKLFPYPTLNNYKPISGFNNSNFSLNFNYEFDLENLKLINCTINTDNKQLKELILTQKAETIIVIECSSSIYRKSFKIGLEEKEIHIPLKDIKDDVVISGYIYAKEDIENYKLEDFLDDYEDYSFFIEKYSILAIDDGSTIKIEYDELKDKKVSSIFAVIRDSDSGEAEMRVRIESQKIIILLPDSAFEKYDKLKNNDTLQNIFFSMLAIPALTEALQKVKSESDDIDTIEMDYSWFISIENAYEKLYGTKLTYELLEKEEVSKLSQKLLNNATVNAIDDLLIVALGNSNKGDEYDE